MLGQRFVVRLQLRQHNPGSKPAAGKISPFSILLDAKLVLFLLHMLGTPQGQTNKRDMNPEKPCQPGPQLHEGI